MAIARNVRFIVRTYELPRKLEQRIIKVATAKFTRTYTETFERQYTYIADLVDKFEKYERYRAAAGSVNAKPASGDPEYEEAVFRYQPPYEATQAQEDQKKREEAMRYALDVMERALDPAPFEFLMYLLRTIDGTPRLDWENACQDLPQIRSRLEQLVQKFGNNGKIAMPKRPIYQVRFNPLQITFARRKLRADPLKFFFDNYHIYGEMTRKELFQFDQGLYQALHYARKLHKAIPESWGRRRRKCR